MDKFIKQQTTLSQSHHMAIPWQSLIQNDSLPAKEASLPERASIVGRIGIQMLSCGTGAWRVRDAMNKIARKLDLSCSADIGLINLTYTCFSDGHSYTQQLSLPNTGVNTDKLNTLENFVKHIDDTFSTLTVRQVHNKINDIQNKPKQYSPIVAGLAAALACSAFIFQNNGI